MGLMMNTDELSKIRQIGVFLVGALVTVFFVTLSITLLGIIGYAVKLVLIYFSQGNDIANTYYSYIGAGLATVGFLLAGISLYLNLFEIVSYVGRNSIDLINKRKGRHFTSATIYKR